MTGLRYVTNNISHFLHLCHNMGIKYHHIGIMCGLQLTQLRKLHRLKPHHLKKIPNDTVYVRIFIDRSTIEVFIDNLTVFSCRAYPSLESSNKIDAIAETGPLKIIEMNAWQLKSFGDTMSNDVCEPAFLPETFFEDTVKPGHSSVPEQGEPTGLLIYPNPAQDYIDVVANHNSGGEASIQIFNMLGECIRQFQLSANSSELIHRIVTKNFGEGMYFLRFSQEGLSTITRFLVLDNK